MKLGMRVQRWFKNALGIVQCNITTYYAIDNGDILIEQYILNEISGFVLDIYSVRYVVTRKLG